MGFIVIMVPNVYVILQYAVVGLPVKMDLMKETVVSLCFEQFKKYICETHCYQKLQSCLLIEILGEEFS